MTVAVSVAVSPARCARLPLAHPEVRGIEPSCSQYGIPRAVEEKRPFDIVSTSRAVEAYVESVHGFQMLYADSYMTRDEFRTMFDHSHYDAMKSKYDPHGAFPEVFEKVCKKAAATWEARK